tara:strand:+ start:28 stop:360 length:333 start_codon:yes stop_codon:yes gene_type:complete
MKYVNMYRTSRCYGGPEEGGWWYTQGEFIKCYGMYSSNGDANLKVKRLQESLTYEPTYHSGYGDHDGVDPSGNGDDAYLIPGGAWGTDDISFLVEDRMGANFPRYTPRYE